jgi:hypothetical protein
MAQFVDCVRTGAEPFANGRRGQEALEIALAVLDAGRMHQAVAIWRGPPLMVTAS